MKSKLTLLDWLGLLPGVLILGYLLWLMPSKDFKLFAAVLAALWLFASATTRWPALGQMAKVVFTALFVVGILGAFAWKVWRAWDGQPWGGEE